jgi:uncharacterized membrane protein
MSLELGRKLGITASLIAVITPVISIISSAFLLFSIINPVFSGSTGVHTVSFSLIDAAVIVLLSLGVISIVGFILFLISMHTLSQYYNEPGIFKNVLYAFILSIVAVVTVFLIELATLFISLERITSGPVTGSASSPLIPFIFFFIIVFAVFFALWIVSAWLYKRAFDSLSKKSGIGNFGTVGTLILTGTVLSIIFIGSILIWVAGIFALMGFHSLKPKITNTSPPSSTVPGASLAPAQNKYCPYCGAENPADSVYCTFCGKQLQ